MKHLFIQSSNECSNNCIGCYSKAHKYEEGILQASVLGEFLSDNLPAEQLSISLNSLSKREGEHQAKIIHTIVGVKNFTKIPLVYITAENLEVINNFPIVFHSNSLSSIKNSDLELLNDEFTLTNYNHLIPRDITSENIDQYIDQMISIGEVVDSIYLIIFKRPVGNRLSKEEIEQAFLDLKHDLTVIETLKKRLPSHILKKVYLDCCLKDIMSYKRTGFGCSANVSKFQIWADGRVSGCPYSKYGVGIYPKKGSDLLQNIKEAKKEYDFEKCYLPQVYDLILERS